MPTLRAASAFCFDLISKENHLLLAPGSLMVDVFVRQARRRDRARARPAQSGGCAR